MTRSLEDFSVAGVASALVGIVDQTVPPAKGEGEFTVKEFQQAVEVRRGVKWTYRQASYRLDNLVAEGGAEKFIRLDPASGRRVVCYAYVGETYDGEA